MFDDCYDVAFASLLVLSVSPFDLVVSETGVFLSEPCDDDVLVVEVVKLDSLSGNGENSLEPEVIVCCFVV